MRREIFKTPVPECYRYPHDQQHHLKKIKEKLNRMKDFETTSINKVLFIHVETFFDNGNRESAV